MKELERVLAKREKREKANVKTVMEELRAELTRRLERREEPQLELFSPREVEQIQRNADAIGARIAQIPDDIAREQRAISDEEAAQWRAGLTSFVESGSATEQWAARQVYLALGVLVAAAAVLGVDACPLEGIDPAAYDRALGLIGTGYQTVVAVAVGYRAAGDPTASAVKLRFPIDEVFTRA